MKILQLKILRLMLAIHAIALWPSAAHAQLTAPREAAPLALGPLSLYPSVKIVDAGRDTNIFNDGAEPKEDYTFTVNSRALAALRLGSNELLFLTGSDYVWFSEHAGERSNNAHYSVRLNLSASRLKPFVGAEHNRARSRPNSEIDARVRRLERAVLGGFAYNVSDRTAITASGRFDEMSYDRGEQFRGVDLAAALNQTGRSFSGGVRYAVTPLTTLLVVADYAEDVFPDSHGRDARSYSIGPTLEFSPDAAIRGRVITGFKIFRPMNDTLPDYKGGVLAAAVSWSLYGRTSFDVEGTRDVSYSYQDTHPYYLLTGVRLQVVHPLIGPLDLQGAVAREHLSYRWRVEAPISTAITRADTTQIFSGGFGINFGRGFRATITGERTKRQSNEDPRQNFRRTRLLSSMTLGF
jgi:hypothetical protein